MTGLTEAEAARLGADTMATIVASRVLPGGTLVRVVADEGDSLVAVEILIAAGPVPESFGDRSSGAHIRHRAANKGSIVSESVVDEGDYWWVDLDEMRPLHGPNERPESYVGPGGRT